MKRKTRYYLIITAFLALIIAFAVITFLPHYRLLSQEEVINNFKENQDKFVFVQKYANRLEENLHLYKSGRRIKYVESQKKDMLKNDVIVQIEYLINNLGCHTISEDSNGNIVFLFGGKYHGIYYIKNGVKPEPHPSSAYYEEIIESWFYFYENRT